MKGLTAKIYAKALSKALLTKKSISKKEIERPARNAFGQPAADTAFLAGVADAGRRLSVFLDLVRKQRHSRLLANIEAATVKILAGESGLDKITVQSARPLSGASFKALKKTMDKETIWEQKINPELIAGARMLKNDSEQIDFSLISKIKKVFAGI